MELEVRKTVHKFSKLFDDLHTKLYLEGVSFQDGVDQLRGLFVQLGKVIDSEDYLAGIIKENRDLKSEITQLKLDLNDRNELLRGKTLYQNLYEELSKLTGKVIETVDFYDPSMVEKLSVDEMKIFDHIKVTDVL